MASEYIKTKRRINGVKNMLLAVAVLNAAVTLIFGIISTFLENPMPIYLQSLITGIVAYIIPLTVYARTTGVTTEFASEKFCFKKCNLSLLILSATMGICWQFVMVVINLPLDFVFSYTDSYLPTSSGELFAAIAVIAILPAVFEELLFRGIVDGSVSELNSKAATIFSAVMFAVLHADAASFIGYIFMGLVLTCIVRRSGSLYAAMLFHLTNNVTALLLGYLNSELFYSPAMTIFIFVAGIACFAALFVFFGSVTKKPKKTEVVKTSRMLSESFVSIPILLCIAVTVAAALLIGYVI